MEAWRGREISLESIMIIWDHTKVARFSKFRVSCHIERSMVSKKIKREIGAKTT